MNFILNRYEISNCLSKLYDSFIILSWYMGSTSKGSLFRLFNNQLGGDKAMSYNGWANYETWNVALWMDNDETSYQYARIAKDYDHYRNMKVYRTGDGVSLWDPILDIKELDDKITEMKA